jgi:hypothetical protein
VVICDLFESNTVQHKYGRCGSAEQSRLQLQHSFKWLSGQWEGEGVSPCITGGDGPARCITDVFTDA